jgi:hypothetical protein
MGSLRLRASAVLGGLGAIATGCADPCLDDGLNQEDCPAADDDSDSEDGSSGATVSASVSVSVSVSNSDSVTDSDTMASNSVSMTDTDTATATDTETASDTESATGLDTDTVDSSGESGTGTLWCVDADGDGFGDPDDCMNTDDPPDGSVDNDDDCDDDDDHTFPGAAENEPDGAAEGCMHDGDEDGWGDADPDGGSIEPGADCYDGNVALNPDTMALSAFLTTFGGAYIVEVSETDGELTETIPIDPNTFSWDPVSATIDEAGTLVINNNSGDALWSVDWVGYCTGETPEAIAQPMPQEHDIDVFCGIAFGPGGALYGIESGGDTLAELNPMTGAVVASMPVMLNGAPYDVGSCGMTFDCHTQQLLFASGFDGGIYRVDETNGELELIVDVPGQWTPTGLGYDPIDRVVHLAANTELYRVAIDGSDTIDMLGEFSFGFGAETVSNIDELPICTE